jgi:hypothetical protein
MKAFQRFNPESPASEFPKSEAAKPAKAAKPQGFRRFQPPKAHLKLAKAGDTLGSFSHGLAAANPQKTLALAALGALAGVPPEKSRVTRGIILAVPDGAPKAWVQGVADLLAMPPHPDWTETGWKVLQEDALSFLREWATQAHALGWDVLDLFGVHAAAPHARLDGMGLVLLLGGRPVIALTEDIVGIRAGSGGTQTFRRHRSPPPGRCLVWELESTS